MSSTEQRDRVYRSGHSERKIGRLTSGMTDADDDNDFIEEESAEEMQHIFQPERTNARRQAAAQNAVQNDRSAAPAGRKNQNTVQRRERRSSQTDRPVRRSAERQETVSVSRDSQSVQTERTAYGWKTRMQEQKKRRTRMLLTIFGSMALIAYTAVAVYFGFHFYEGTVIYGIDCSQMTLEEVKAVVADKLDEYVLTIEEREDKTETISAGQIDLEFVDNGSIDQMLKEQYSFIWPVKMLMKQDEVNSVAFKYDAKKVEQTLNMMDCFDILRQIAPKNAYMGDTDTGFEVVPEVMGTTLNRPQTIETVLKALDAGATTVSLDENNCYVNPEIYQDNEELVKDTAAMNELAGAHITYDFGPNQEVINSTLIREWIVELEDGSFVIDENCVWDYVTNLAATYDTFGLPVDFYTSIGTTVTLSGGDYGWCIDQDQTFVELMVALENDFRGTMEPAYLYEAMSHENDGIGYTYVEICISQQRMWCYEDGICIVDTPVVTGNPNKDNATPSGGIWAIDAKMTEYVLEGEGYEAPVDYWMPFNEDVGIHDMKERAHFGSTIYLTNGSHGCVNTPYDMVEIIYNTVSIGTPVIVYE